LIEPEHLPTLSREDLLALVAELQRQLAALTATHEALRAEIAQLTRGGKRQAAPFSKGTRVTEPKPPGRKPGTGTFCDREAPPLEAIPEPPVVHTDDTGWRVGGEPAHPMAFETEAATVSQIRPHHRHQEVQEVIPADDAGVMVTDRGQSDDAQTFKRVDQPKCLPHMLRSIRDVVERKTGRARDFGVQLKAVLQEALALWHRQREDPVADFKVEAEALQAELTYQLWDRRLNGRDHQRRLNALGWHHDRGNVLRFLTDPRIEPTNHRAERALRPAVIARKVSHGSKNGAGAHAFAACTSVVRTLAKQRIEALVENLYQLFRAPGVHATPP
jgi:Transposase IS66 family